MIRVCFLWIREVGVCLWIGWNRNYKIRRLILLDMNELWLEGGDIDFGGLDNCLFF